MQNGIKRHIVIEKHSLTRWYDNPDISDFMFAMFGVLNSTIKPPSLCLHTYDKASKKGLSKFNLNNNGWQATELVEDLSNRIVYHPILTVSTTDPAHIKRMFDGILDGIDGVNGSNGVPSVIIIPILMHKNHFGTIAIKPAKDRKKTEVYYFNSLGTMNSYRDEEVPIYDFMKKRYGIGEIVSNTQKWQVDDNQCGPYAIWFVQQITKLVVEDNLNACAIRELFTQIWHMGVGNLIYEGKAIEVRTNHIEILEGLNTNFSTSIFLDFKVAVKRNPKWYEDSSLTFKNLDLQNSRSVTNQINKILYSGGDEVKFRVRDCEGVDAFELQSKTQQKLLTCLAELHLLTKKEHLLGRNLLFTTTACAAGGTILGILSAYVFKASPNISMLRML